MKSECKRLKSELIGNNAGRRVGEVLDRYAEALAGTLHALDIFRLGHAGIALRSAVSGAREALNDANYAELAGLLTSHELFIRQDPQWNCYLEKAERASLDLSQVEQYAKIGEHITNLLENFYPAISNDIPKEMEALRRAISENALNLSINCYGYLKSLENIALALIEQSLEFAARDAQAFREVFFGAAGTFADDFVGETRQRIIKRGADAVAVTIVLASGLLLANVAGYSETLFGWMGPARDFLEAVAKSKPQ